MMCWSFLKAPPIQSAVKSFRFSYASSDVLEVFEDYFVVQPCLLASSMRLFAILWWIASTLLVSLPLYFASIGFSLSLSLDWSLRIFRKYAVLMAFSPVLRTPILFSVP